MSEVGTVSEVGTLDVGTKVAEWDDGADGDE
jgi:hypothetical protein